jgi:hypothetical protein
MTRIVACTVFLVAMISCITGIGVFVARRASSPPKVSLLATAEALLVLVLALLTIHAGQLPWVEVEPAWAVLLVLTCVSAIRYWFLPPAWSRTARLVPILLLCALVSTAWAGGMRFSKFVPQHTPPSGSPMLKAFDEWQQVARGCVTNALADGLQTRDRQRLLEAVDATRWQTLIVYCLLGNAHYLAGEVDEAIRYYGAAHVELPDRLAPLVLFYAAVVRAGYTNDAETCVRTYLTQLGVETNSPNWKAASLLLKVPAAIEHQDLGLLGTNRQAFVCFALAERAIQMSDTSNAVRYAEFCRVTGMPDPELAASIMRRALQLEGGRSQGSWRR